MGFDFNHLLVPLDAHYQPRTSAILAFLEAVASKGFVGTDAAHIVESYPDFNPFDAWFHWGLASASHLPQAGTTPGRRPTRWTRAREPSALAQALEEGGSNYQATTFSKRRPRSSPLRGLEVCENGVQIPMTDPRFDDEYWIAITCHVSEHVRMMSDDGHPDKETQFGEVADPSIRDAVAYCPSNLERYIAKDIGAARFWISISAAGWVCASEETFTQHELELANPSLVKLAESILEVDFGQTCVWSV